jgi:isocitrate lyase
MKTLDQEVAETAAWLATSRFDGIVRLHTARQVVEQRGHIPVDYAVARGAADAFHTKLRELFGAKQSITTFGPYSPGQAIVMKRRGIEGIYLGGWATSAKGGVTEDPGADLASYPLSQVPDEAAAIVRALLTADRNQRFMRSRMTADQLADTPEIDFRPFIIADADTGHGGDAHVRNLIRRFVEAGVPGYHIEDQKPGVKKCGHQGGKVLVAQNEQIQRLNAARLQLDIMQVAGLIVARTDAEAANLLDSNGDERDQPFVLGATNLDVPSYKAVVLAIHKQFFERGVEEIRGHLMFALPEAECVAATEWLTHAGVMPLIAEKAAVFKNNPGVNVDSLLDAVTASFLERWQLHAGLKTYRQAVADAIALRISEGNPVEMTVEAWLEFSKDASWSAARSRAESMGIPVVWDCELAKTPEGHYQVQGGLDYAIAKSLAAAPFADVLWMETNTANLAEAEAYADAIHAKFPDKMLAYNLSPSFNWDTTGMSDDEMRAFPAELGKLGFVFNFITYGGHQIDGLAAEEFTTALQQDGMLALARLQRKLRLIDSPYRTPQTLAGGPRLDAALMGASGRTATTKAMGKGSTQHQHLVETEASPKLLEQWLKMWSEHYGFVGQLRARLRPHSPGSDLLELDVLTDKGETLSSVIFDHIRDRRGRTILAVRDQLTSPPFRQKRLMTLVQLFMIHRYRATSIHYLTPNDDNAAQAARMKDLGIFTAVKDEIGQVIVATIDRDRVKELVASDSHALALLVRKQGDASAAQAVP